MRTQKYGQLFNPYVDFYRSTNFALNVFIMCLIHTKIIFNNSKGVIGIGGATRSGKTSLSRALFNHYSSQNDIAVYHIGQDSYFKTIKPKYFYDTLSFDNWECPEAVDFDLFYHAIIETKNQAKEQLQATDRQYKEAIIIVEGFLLYYEERISSLLDVKYFIAIPKHLCYERRYLI